MLEESRAHRTVGDHRLPVEDVLEAGGMNDRRRRELYYRIGSGMMLRGTWRC